MVDSTVSAGYAGALLAFAAGRGADRDALLRTAGIAAADIDTPDARLPFDRFVRLMQAAKAASRDPALALRFGAASALAGMTAIGLLTRASETVEEAIERMNRYARLVVEVDGHESGPRFAIVHRKDGAWIEDRRRNPNAFPELTESTWARFIHGVARILPGEAAGRVKSVHVTHPRPGHGDAYEAVLGAPVIFGSDRNALQVDESWLSLRLNPPRRYLRTVAEERAASLMERLDRETSLRGAVERLLLPLLHRPGETGMDRIASAMGVSRPTLYRRLKAEGLSYEDILDDLRRRVAMDQLGTRKMSANDTAYLVGFSDPSAFSRAYMRWTGERPGAGKRR